MPHVNNHRSDDQRDCVWSLADVGFFYGHTRCPANCASSHVIEDRVGDPSAPLVTVTWTTTTIVTHEALLPATAMRVAARELATAPHTGQPVPDAVDRLLARHEGEDTERDDCAVQTRHLDQPCHPGVAVG